MQDRGGSSPRMLGTLQCTHGRLPSAEEPGPGKLLPAGCSRSALKHPLDEPFNVIFTNVWHEVRPSPRHASTVLPWQMAKESLSNCR